MLKALATLCIELIVPPRAGERLVRALALEDLHDLQTQDGLPYHEPAVRDLVWEIKYYANPRAAKLAGELLAEEILALAAEEIGVPLLLPVPMHSARLRERGHNQTEVLCEAIVSSFTKSSFQNPKTLSAGVPPGFSQELFTPLQYAPYALARVVDTPTQQGLERTKRLRNVKNSMVADPDRTAGRVCIVVDDVTTTGATLNEAKRALKAAGARVVYCVALAFS